MDEAIVDATNKGLIEFESPTYTLGEELDSHRLWYVTSRAEGPADRTTLRWPVPLMQGRPISSS